MYEDSEVTEVDHGFGVARHFMPLPHTVVGSHCTWQLRLNTVPARIPGTVPTNNHPLNITIILQKQSQRFSATVQESNVGGQSTTTASR